MDKCVSGRTTIYITLLLVFFVFSFYTCQSSDFISFNTLEYPGQCKLTSKGLFKGSLIGADGKAYVFVFSLTDYQSSEPDAYFSSIYVVDENCHYKKIYEIDERFGGPECMAIGTDNNIYFVLGDIQENNSYIYSLSTKGKINWNITLENGNNCEGIAIGNDGTIYVQLERILYSISQDKDIKWNMSFSYTTFDGPLIGEGDNLFFAYGYEGIYLSSISKEGGINWSYDLGNEIPGKAVIGPSGNIYMTSVIKGEIYSLYLNSFDKEGNLNWKVFLGEGTVMEIYESGGLLIDEDETIYISGILNSVKAVNSVDGSIKWNKEGNGNLDFIDGQGNIYFLDYVGGYKEKVFDKNGNDLSIIEPVDGYFSIWSLISGNYFYSYDYHDFFIYNALGSGYSKSAWPMRYHDPQRTNRWNGGF